MSIDPCYSRRLKFILAQNCMAELLGFAIESNVLRDRPQHSQVNYVFVLTVMQLGAGTPIKKSSFHPACIHSPRWCSSRAAPCRWQRWSMIDVSLLGALVWFGNVITIEPGIGAVAFCTVVILWDATERPRQMSAVPALSVDPKLAAG